MKDLTGVIVGAVVVIVVIIGVLWYKQNQKPDTINTPSDESGININLN